MPITLGILAQSRQAPVAAGSYDLLETISLSSSAASVEFTNLAATYGSTYKHLQVRFTCRAASSFTTNGLYSRLNSDSGTNYNGHYLIGTGSSVVSGSTGNVNYALTGIISAATAGANDLLDSFSSSKNKTFRTLSGVLSDTRIDLHSALWRNTDAVTTWTILAESGNLVAGTRISLYGIKG
jgi:hypothetical protein